MNLKDSYSTNQQNRKCSIKHPELIQHTVDTASIQAKYVAFSSWIPIIYNS